MRTEQVIAIVVCFILIIYTIYSLFKSHGNIKENLGYIISSVGCLILVSNILYKACKG